MSCILNKPLFLLFIHLAAVRAPSAKICLEKATCFNSIFSVSLEKQTECLPIVFPFRVIKKLILFFFIFPFLFKKVFHFNDFNVLFFPKAAAFASINAVPEG